MTTYRVSYCWWEKTRGVIDRLHVGDTIEWESEGLTHDMYRRIIRVLMFTACKAGPGDVVEGFLVENDHTVRTFQLLLDGSSYDTSKVFYIIRSASIRAEAPFRWDTLREGVWAE